MPTKEATALSSLSGVWTRRSLSVEGQAPFEDSQVTWAQLGPWFVDVRSPQKKGARPAAFSSRVEWAPPRIRFLRDLDLAFEAPEDTALLEVGDDHLVERGEVTIGGRSISYVEVWTRRRADGESRMVLEGRTIADGPVCGRLIQWGDVLVALIADELRGVRAAALEVADEGWRLLHRVGVLEPPPSEGVKPGCHWAGLEWAPAIPTWSRPSTSPSRPRRSWRRPGAARPEPASPRPETADALSRERSSTCTSTPSPIS